MIMSNLIFLSLVGDLKASGFIKTGGSIVSSEIAGVIEREQVLSVWVAWSLANNAKEWTAMELLAADLLVD